MSNTPAKSFNERLNEWDEEDLRTILKTKWGRRFVWRFMSRCGIFSQSFVPDDPYATAFNEGRRSVGNTLLKQVIDINPEAYILMTKAAKKEEEYGRQLEPKPEPDESESTD